MKKAAALLSFDFDASRFGRHGINVISNETRERVEKALREVEKIAQKVEEPIMRLSADEMRIYRTFMRLAPTGISRLREEFNTVRKIRKLSYALSYSETPHLSIACSEYLSLALELIESFWRYSLFLGLFEALLKEWLHLNDQNAKMLMSFMEDRIERYDGKRKLLKSIREHMQFYSKANGAHKLGATLVLRGVKLTDVCGYLGLSKHMSSYGYFSDVAAAFTHVALRESNYENHIIDISEFLKLHQQKTTSKRCYSRIIPALSSVGNSMLQERIKEDALRLIGDPANDAYWQPWQGASEEEKDQLKKAQAILNEWLTGEFISIFFEKIAMDSDRKNFWIKYAGDISRFRIYGSQLTYHRLRADERIEPYLDTRFGFLQGGGSSQCALVMSIKDYVLVEFSVKGAAFYAYRSSNPICPDLTKASLHMTDLRQRHLCKPLMRRQGHHIYSHREEGSYSHQLSWEPYLEWWLKRYLGV